MQDYYFEKEKNLEVIDSADVLVVGAGPAGVAAAISAGRLGASVILVEQNCTVGGVSTIGSMSHFAGRVNSRLYDEILSRQSIVENRKDPTITRETINPEILKVVYLQMLFQAGVRIKLYTFVSDVICENGTVKGVIVETKSQRCIICAKTVVDCSGDGDVAAKSGAEYYLGRETDGKMQPATLMFKVGGVDYSKAVFPCSFESYVETEKGELQHLAKEKLKFPMGHVLLYKTSLPGVVTCNMTNSIDVDGTNSEDLTKADIQCRLQMYEIEKFLREYVPGYENCFIISSASYLGVRETRHFVGEYVLNEDDVYHAKYFEDWVVRDAYFNFDVHNLTGAGLDKTGVQNEFYQRNGYCIPYRSLIPKKLKNVLLAGRCISGTHMAHSNYRVMPMCVATGEAAGTAAFLACRYGGEVRKVRAEEIQKLLTK